MKNKALLKVFGVMLVGVMIFSAIVGSALVAPAAASGPVVPDQVINLYDDEFDDDGFTTRIIEWHDYDYADIYWDYDEGDAMTATLTLYISPDRLNWIASEADGTLINAATASAETYNGNIAVTGYWAKLVMTAVSTGTSDIDLKMVLR